MQEHCACVCADHGKCLLDEDLECGMQVAKQSRHRDVANRAFDVLKEEALKPSVIPTVSLLSIGNASHIQAFKVSENAGTALSC